MNVATELVPADVAYEKIRRCIYKLCWKYSKYRTVLGDFEDILAQANLYFAEAYNTYDPSKGKLITWCYNNIQWGFKDTLRKEAAKSKRLTRIDTDLSLERAKPIKWNMRKAWDDVSEDTKTVLKLIFESPLDMLLLARIDGSEKKPKSVRKALVEYLNDLGWSGRRIMKVVGEIQETLKV